MDDVESDGPERTDALDFPSDLSKLSLTFADLLIPVSEPLVFDGVEDDEELETKVTEPDGTAVLVPGRRVVDRVDDSALDEDMPFSKNSPSSPVVLDADEG